MHLKRIKILAILVPTLGLLLFEAVRHFGIQPWLGETSPHFDEHIISGLILLAAVIAFSLVIFSLLERLHDQLLALNEAGIALTQDLSVDRVLTRVAEMARAVAQASYASVVTDGDPERTVAFGELPDGAETLSLPIVVKGSRLGELVLAGPRGGRFRTSDRSALETFAAQAGVALENARLFEMVQDLAAARERVRIGMDLHDGVIQELYAVGLKVEDASDLVEADPGQAVTQMRDVHELVRKVIGDVRSYVYELHDGEGTLSLEAALEHVVAEFPVRSPLISLHVDTDALLPAVAAGNVLHIVREAIANALQHADATSVEIHAAHDEGGLVVSVCDDGKGFDPGRVRLGFGLGDMRERASWCRGTIQLDSTPGEGTTIRLALPPDLSAAEEAER